MRLRPKPPVSAKHIEERLKLAANGLQALTLALLGTSILAPLFNVTQAGMGWKTGGAALVAAIAESVAFELLRYIPSSTLAKGS